MAALLASALHAQDSEDPTIFAPGIISNSPNEYSAVFAPDCRSVWYTITNGTEGVIVTSHIDRGRWTQPKVAEFSGRWHDMEASMAPDGSYMIFASNRPAVEGGAPIDGNFGGSIRKGRGGNLWRIDRRGNGWSAPVRLPEIINSSTAVFSPSIAADGSLYFMKASPGTGKFLIYRSQVTNGQYAAAERLPFNDEQRNNLDVAVAPDESFLVFLSRGPPAAGKDLGLLIVFRRNGVWGDPTTLGPRVNATNGEAEPRIAPDGHTLFFSSGRVVITPPRVPIDLDRIRIWNNGLDHIWRADIASRLPSVAKRGCSVPAHDHEKVAEALYVVDGEFINEGKRYGPGTSLHFKAGHVHGPHSTEKGCTILDLWTDSAATQDANLGDFVLAQPHMAGR